MTQHFSQVLVLGVDRVHQGEKAHRGNEQGNTLIPIRNNNDHTSHVSWRKNSIQPHRGHKQIPVQAGNHQRPMILPSLFRGKGPINKQQEVNSLGSQSMSARINLTWSKLKKIITELDKPN
jgi:stress-induced morphogen